MDTRTENVLTLIVGNKYSPFLSSTMSSDKNHYHLPNLPSLLLLNRIVGMSWIREKKRKQKRKTIHGR